MKEPKVTVVLPGFWALNKEEQAQMIAKLEKMKVERDNNQQQPKQDDENPYNLTPEQLEEVKIAKEAEKEGRFVMEGWEAMNTDLMEELADGEEL